MSGFTQLTSWDNLLLAYHKAAKGKRGHPNVAVFEYKLEDNLLHLQHELKDQTYQPGEYHSFYIHDPKKRLISAAPFRDRVVHHALCNLVEPIFEKSFIFDSYANRIGKGTHKALDRAQQFARRFRYVLVCDVRQFFPSIDHAVLRDILASSLKRTQTDSHFASDCQFGDGRIMWLIDQILKSGIGVLSEEYEMAYFPGDDLFVSLRPRGLPIGNLTSQFWGNCYLNPFDHYVKRALHCKGYLRYVDDFLLFSDNLQELSTWRAQAIQELRKYRLTLHDNQCQPRPVTEGIPFLGFILYPDHRLLKHRKGIAFQRKLANLCQDYRTAKITFSQLDASIKGWVNHVRYANTWGLRRSLLTDR